MEEHLHLVEGAGYFFFPEVSAAEGTKAFLHVSFTGGAESVLLRAQVWARPSNGGVWLEIRGAALWMTSGTRPARIATEQLILAEGKVIVTADDNHDPLHSVPYDNVTSIHYSTGRDPMWKSPEGPTPVACWWFQATPSNSILLVLITPVVLMVMSALVVSF